MTTLTDARIDLLRIDRTILFVGLALLFPTAIILRVVYALFLHPLKDIPGPFFARFTRLWELREMTVGNFHETIVSLHRENGPVVRISPNLYSFNSLEDQKKIYALNGKFTKTRFYVTAGRWDRPNSFSLRDEVEHSNRKKKYANFYSMSSLVHYEGAVDRMTAVCMRKLAQVAAEKRKLLVPEFMQCYAFDVIGEITVDKNFGMMEQEGDVDDMMKLVRRAITYQGTVGVIPEFNKTIQRIGQLFGQDNAGVAIEKLVKTTVERHNTQGLIEKEDPVSDPFISKALRAQGEGRINNEHLYDILGGNIAAGSDTTGITLSAALWYLYRTPHALVALRKEIDDMAAKGKISDPVTWHEAQDMPYLQAVIRETLRIHPAVSYLLPREVPKGGIELAGRFFPEGTQVGVSAWALHRNPDVYGPNAGNFKPERFLNNGEGQSGTAQAANMFTFGAGSRTCIGKNVSLLEITKVVPQIVRKFDLVFETDEPWEIFSTWFSWENYYGYIEPRKTIS